MTKVTFSIDDKKWAEIMRLTGAKTKTEAVNKALREYVEEMLPQIKEEKGDTPKRKD